MLDACRFEVDVASADVGAFAALSGDLNPLHVDPEYAATTEYGRPIAHGALLIALVSRVLGMHIPGTKSLILSMRVKFPNVLPYPARVEVIGQLRQFDRGRQMGTVHVSISDVGRRKTVLESEVSFVLHELVDGAKAALNLPLARPLASNDDAAGTRQLLITGGTGGLGEGVLTALSSDYRLTCFTRRAGERIAESNRAFVDVDVEDDRALDLALDALNPSDFYAVVHMSTPPVPRGFVSDDLAMVRLHLRHAMEVPLILARWARKPGSAVKRVVLVGSLYGSKHPKPHMGAYSMAKAAMELLPPLLAVDLAGQGATVNLIAPGIMPVGLNAGMPHRTQKSLAAGIATGRLLQANDVASLIHFLLSEQASQLNGAVIPLDGGFFS